MPIVLMQRTWRDGPQYKDTEFVIYHFPRRQVHRYVDIKKPIRFATLVPFDDPSGKMYESRFPNRNAFQGRSIRYISEKLSATFGSYRAEFGKAKPALAFGSMLRSDVGWVSEILQGNDIAFVARDGSALRPINELARQLPIFL